jgi:hypothetical protein
MPVPVDDGLDRIATDVQKLISRYVKVRRGAQTWAGLLYKVERDTETTADGLARFAGIHAFVSWRAIHLSCSLCMVILSTD